MNPTKKQLAQAVLEAERRVRHTARLLSAAERAQRTSRLPSALAHAQRHLVTLRAEQAELFEARLLLERVERDRAVEQAEQFGSLAERDALHAEVEALRADTNRLVSALMMSGDSAAAVSRRASVERERDTLHSDLSHAKDNIVLLTDEVERLRRADLHCEELRAALSEQAAAATKAEAERDEARRERDALRAEVARLKTSMAEHFQRDHLAGDGPEIDRWKARVRELEAQIETARQLERQACAVEAETKRHAPMTPGGTCCECARWIAGTWPGESDDHADTCSAGKLEHEADYAIARCIRLRRSP